MEKRRVLAVTLVEILVTLIIVAILVALALPQFTLTRERSLAKEAKANLKLIDAAERIYRMENGFYYPYDTSTQARDNINTNLKISLAAGTTQNNWQYQVTGNGSGGDYTAVADRTDTGGYRDCTYTMTKSTEEPQPNSSCP